MTARPVILAMLLAGCDDKAKRALPPPTFGSATITGTVRFLATPPERRMIDVSSCYDNVLAYQEETIVVGSDRGLRDVVVYLKDAPASDGSNQPTLTLDQVGCRYVPHVLAVQAGQPLLVKTSDPCFHNVHLSGDGDRADNFGLRGVGESKTVSFARAGSTVTVQCDVHPWMRAALFVTASPFFAVTAADGRFTIARVPSGRHTLVAWHPLLGTREASLDVAADGTASVEVGYAPPDARSLAK